MEIASFTCHCGIYAVGRCEDCGGYLCREHGVSTNNGWVCSTGCRELERQYRRGEEARHYRALVDQINGLIPSFVTRMTAAHNPGAVPLGEPQIKRRARFWGDGVNETLVQSPTIGWRVASVGTGDSPEDPGSIKLAGIGLDVRGKLVDMTYPAHEPPPWNLGEQPPGAPPRDYDDYDYRYIAEREIPRSIHELLETHTGTGLSEHEMRCYYCGHAGFHQLSAMGTLWSLENWPRSCEDCIQCWVGP